MTKQRIFTFLFYLSTSFAFLLGAAHFYRASLYPYTFLCILCILLSFQKSAYIRNILALALLGLGTRYCLVTIDFIQMRQAFGQPWLRLFAILGTVSFFIFLNALYVYRQKIRFTKNRELTKLSTLTFLIIFALLACLHFKVPHLLLANRFFHGFGIVQAFLVALWGAFVVVKLSDKSIAEKWRVHIWRIFSLVFFGQFFLALLGYSVFLMGNAFHFPIPAMIVAGPLYRESGFFMPILFMFSFIFVGSAWCSHLCYFGVWDTVPKKAVGHKHRHQKANAENKTHLDNKLQEIPTPKAEVIMSPHMKKFFQTLPYIIFIAMIIFVFICKNYEIPTSLTASLILLVGLIFFPLHFFISRKYLISSYCLYVCPLGLIMRILNKITRNKFSWHLSFTESCTKCGKCARFCRYEAITKASIKTHTISEACTLCKHCMHVCRKNGLELSYCGFKGKNRQTLNTIFTLLITILHSLFLAVAMV